MRTGIVGLGALGSSLGLALRARKEWANVTGFDASARVQNEAKRKGAIREGTSDITDLLSDADVVVLAVPARAVVALLREFGSRLRPGVVVTDLATTKGAVLQAAERYVPVRSGFVGGHPLVSSAPGIAHATPVLYRQRPWCLAAAPGTQTDRLEAVSALVEAAGARSYFVDAAEHDAWVAATEGLPLLFGAALARLSAESDAWRELVRASGPAFDVAVQGAAGGEGPELALTAGEPLVSWLDRLLADLSQWREAIAAGQEETLLQRFQEAAAARERWNQERASQARAPGGD